MREFKLEELMPIEAVKNKIWKIFDLLRNENSISGENHVVLYLLSVYKDNLISDGIYSTNENLNERLIKSIRENCDAHANEYLFISKFFEPLISKLSNSGLNSIIKCLFEIDLKILKANFSDIFDDVIYRIAQAQGRYGSEFIQPLEISRFISNLAELPEKASIFNPFAGLASFGVFLDQGQDYFGQELNQKTWAIGALRLMAYERPGASRLVCDDSILHWPPPEERFDLVISTPPIGIRLGHEYKHIQPNPASIEEFLIERGIKSLKAKGKLIALLPATILFRGLGERRLREYLVTNDLIDTIISLPGGILINTSIPLVILVLSKDKKMPQMVRIIEAKKFVQSKGIREKILNDYGLNGIIQGITQDEEVIKFVSNDQIREQDYNLSVPRYFQKQFDGVLFGSVVSLIRGQRSTEGEIGNFVRIRDLKDDKLNFILDVVKVEKAIIPKPAQKISESCLLLATRWKTLKPTFFEYTGESIYVTPDTIALKINSNEVDLNYLINELYSDYVSEQIEAKRIGGVVPAIRKEDLLSIKINLPSIENQRAKVQGAIEAHLEEKKKEIDFFKKIHGLETEIVEQNTYLRHTLAGPASNLKSSISNIKSIILEKVIKSFPEILYLKVSDLHQNTLADYLEFIERDVIKIYDSVSRQLKTETYIEHKVLESIDIVSFLKGYVKEIEDNVNLNFTIDLDTDEEALLDEKGEMTKTYIQGNADLLKDLFNNLISNAVAHAFTNGSKNRIEIMLIKYADDSFKNEISILFSNTGKPFPKDFKYNQFIRKGFKAGENAGDGFGGWLINEIMKKMNGNFNIEDEKGQDGNYVSDLVTTFELNFPIFELEVDEKI